MKECIGLIFIFSAIIIGAISLFCFELTIKEKKILTIASFELFICLIVFRSYLLAV